MTRKPPSLEVLDKKELEDLEYREMLQLIRPTAEQLKELTPRAKESSDDYFARYWWFFARELLVLFLTTENEAIKAKLGMGLLNFGITPKSAIDISVRRSPVDNMDDGELIEKLVDRLLQHPQGRKMIEDKLGRKAP